MNCIQHTKNRGDQLIIITNQLLTSIQYKRQFRSRQKKDRLTFFIEAIKMSVNLYFRFLIRKCLSQVTKPRKLCIKMHILDACIWYYVFLSRWTVDVPVVVLVVPVREGRVRDLRVLLWPRRRSSSKLRCPNWRRPLNISSTLCPKWSPNPTQPRRK